MARQHRTALVCLLLAAPLCAQTPSTPAVPATAASSTAPSTVTSATDATATAPATPAMLSSRAAYDEAVRPLETTRRVIGNWSDVEVAALNLAIQQAGSACTLRDPLRDAVSDLVDLARLCGVGQNWEIDMLAAHRYIAAPDAPKPQLTQAYAYAVEAELRLKMGSAGLMTAEEMLGKVPYDSIASGAYNMALDYLQFVDTTGALALANKAQPLLLDRLKASAPAADTPALPVTPGDPAALTATQAYRDALRLPALEVYLGRLSEASVLAAAVEQAVPAQLAGDDALLIAAERRRYALLGHRLPPIDIAISLDPEHAPTQELPLPGLTTALLLFPDWCAQCIRMGPQFPEGTFTVGGRPAAFYALLATTRPSTSQRPFATPAPGAAEPAHGPLDQLRGTPTLLVPAATLLQLESSEYPLLVLVDEKGVVRLHQTVGDDALQSGSTMDSAISNMGKPAGPALTAPTPRLGGTPALRR